MKYLSVVAFVFILSACGSTGDKKSNDNTLTEQQELSVADSLSQGIQMSGQNLKKEVEEAKESIDQLLEGI